VHPLDDGAEDSGRCPHRDAYTSNPLGAELRPGPRRHSTAFSENMNRLIPEPQASTVEPCGVGSLWRRIAHGGQVLASSSPNRRRLRSRTASSSSSQGLPSRYAAMLASQSRTGWLLWADRFSRLASSCPAARSEINLQATHGRRHDQQLEKLSMTTAFGCRRCHSERKAFRRDK
jgi:hypothetical protein